MASVSSWLPFARASAIGWVPIAKSRLPPAIGVRRRRHHPPGERHPALPVGEGPSGSAGFGGDGDDGPCSSAAANLERSGTSPAGDDDIDDDEKETGDQEEEEPVNSLGLLAAASAEDRVCFNVSGKKYETWPQTLQKYPDTLLGSEEKDFFYDSSTNEVITVLIFIPYFLIFYSLCRRITKMVTYST